MKKFTFYFIFAILASLILESTVLGQIAQVGSAQSAENTGTTITILKPSGIQVGDVMIANITQNDNSGGTDLGDDASSLGWTMIDGRALNGGANPEYWGTILYKVAVLADVAATSYTFALDAQADGGVGAIAAFRGVDVTGGVTETGAPGGPFDVDPGIINGIADDDVLNAASITTVSPNAAVIMLGLVGNNVTFNADWQTATSPGPLVELYDANTDNGADNAVGAAWNLKLVAGSTGAGSVTISATDPNGSILIALRSSFQLPIVANLWATSSDGNQVSSYTVVNGLYVSGPTNIFVPSGGSTAALGRSDKPTQVNGHFYWLPNSGTNGVVNVWASTAAGGSQTNIATFDVNGSSTNTLGFVRLGMGPDGTGWILAGDGTTLYLARFLSNGVNPVTVTVEDASVSLTGGLVSTFQNGDICVSGNGNLYALANDGSGVTQIFIGAPAGAATTLVKKWDLEDGVGNPFTGSVNGVAFDLLGSLYVSTADGLYFIDQFTVNGPAGTVECVLVDAQTGLQDLASNFFPTQSVLPVKLISFSGNLNNNLATLNWQTENEQNFSQYVVERKGSADYVAVGSKPSLNSAGRSSYQYIDDLSSVNGNVFYYRLKLEDLDGRYNYSNVIMVRKDQKTITGITVNPNPVLDGIATIRFTATANNVVNLKVIDMTGKVVLQQQNQVFEGTNSVSLNGLNRLLPGVYVLQMNNGQELSMFKFTVAH